MLSKFDIEYLRARISEWPTNFNEPKIDYSNLLDEEKFVVYLFSYRHRDFAIYKKTIMRVFGWSSYKVTKLRKTINNTLIGFHIDVVTIIDPETGLLDGKGYILNII